MRRCAFLLTAALLILGCGGSSGSGNASPRPSPSSSPRASAATSEPPPIAGVYGLILFAGTLQLIKHGGSIAATAPGLDHPRAMLNPARRAQRPAPVAQPRRVYFRDGDTKIRMLVPPAGAVDVTTVPGGSGTVSFFSVSRTTSGSQSWSRTFLDDVDGLRGCRDLLGGGHHADIYTATTQKGKSGTTCGEGWHQGALVLAVVPACTFEAVGLQPTEWHVSDAVTGSRLATIRGTNCVLSTWPSAAGVGCMDPQGLTTLFDWAGKVVSVTGPGIQGAGSTTVLSPAGQSIFFSTGISLGQSTPTTRIIQLGPGPYATLQGHAACGWIDEDHLLAGDAVIQFPAETPGNLQVTATATPWKQAASARAGSGGL